MTKKSIYGLIGVIAILSIAAELCGIHLHSASWWPLPFGYNIFFGFMGCCMLIFISKIIMGPLLQRNEDYYDHGGEDDD